jgi:riboflavin synthase
MFTGLVSDLGTVRALVPAGTASDLRIEIATAWDTGGVEIGASVACSGCCLTVVEKGQDERGGWMAFNASGETLSKTTLGRWRAGTRVNLERSLRVGDELGGHLVSGHVDGVGVASSAVPEGGSVRWRFRPPPALMPFIAAKGSVAVDGVSLTVNDVDADGFGVNIIPHTATVTGFGTLRPGDPVNLEVDMLARYVARILGASGGTQNAGRG